MSNAWEQETDERISELEKKGKNHNDSIIELRNLIQGNAISDLNHYEANDKEIAELKEAFDKREEHQFNDYFKLQRFEKVLREFIIRMEGLGGYDFSYFKKKLDVGKFESEFNKDCKRWFKKEAKE